MPKELSISESTLAYQGYFDLHIDQLKRTDGSTLSYTVLKARGNAVVVLGITEKGNFLLNREYRHPTGLYLWSCPGGGLEKGEDPIEGGKRELLEETGYDAKKLTLMGSAYPLPAICDQKIYFLFAEVKQVAAPDRHPFEFIDTHEISEEDLRKRAKEGDSLDGILLTALHFYSWL